MPPNIQPTRLLPPHLSGNNVQREVAGDGFRGENIEWFEFDNNSLGRELTGNDTFTLDGRYIARITLTADNTRYFVLGSNVHITTFNNTAVSHRWCDDTFKYYEAVLYLTFDPAHRWNAGRFSLRDDIEGDFKYIYVYTHYLGELRRENFIITFGGVPVNISEVSHYRGGYYRITFANYLSPAAGVILSVEMADLPYHIPYPIAVSIEPRPGTPTGPTGPSLGTGTAPVGGRVPLNDFPQGTGLHIYLSVEALIDYDCIFWQTVVMGNAVNVTDFYPSNFLRDGFYVPANAIQGNNFVYIVDRVASLPTIEFIGTLNIEPPLISGGSFVDTGLVTADWVYGIYAIEEYPE